MRGLIAIAYFFACGYLFAKYEGDKILAAAAHKAFRSLVAEASLIAREAQALPPGRYVAEPAMGPAFVIDLTGIGDQPRAPYSETLHADPADWWIREVRSG